MYNCFDIAKVFLKLSKEEGIPMPPMKLLKLIYIAHGYFLGFTDKPLFKNEIQAWKYGPVIPDLYFIIKRFSNQNVGSDVIDLYSENELKPSDYKFVQSVWNAYKRFDGLQLSSKTHEDNTPWYKSFVELKSNIIDNFTIKKYYKELIELKKKRIIASRKNE
jgi:uncharacterized phage-associated protein